MSDTPALDLEAIREPCCRACNRPFTEHLGVQASCERIGELKGHIAELKKDRDAARADLAAKGAECERLKRENDYLRFRHADSNLPCVYCDLPAADMAKCRSGFPGCARADDLMIEPRPRKDCTLDGGPEHEAAFAEGKAVQP